MSIWARARCDAPPTRAINPSHLLVAGTGFLGNTIVRRIQRHPMIQPQEGRHPHRPKAELRRLRHHVRYLSARGIHGGREAAQSCKPSLLPRCCPPARKE